MPRARVAPAAAAAAAEPSVLPSSTHTMWSKTARGALRRRRPMTDASLYSGITIQVSSRVAPAGSPGRNCPSAILAEQDRLAARTCDRRSEHEEPRLVNHFEPFASPSRPTSRPTRRSATAASIWHLAQVREGAVLGENCVVGRGAYIGTGVRDRATTARCRTTRWSTSPRVLGDGVFIGPAVVLTNDTYPRAVNPDGSLKSAHDWEPVGVTIGDGASDRRPRGVRRAGDDRRVGDGRGRRRRHQGRPDFALVAGVPARRIGWVGKAGHPARARRRRSVALPRDRRRATQRPTEPSER